MFVIMNKPAGYTAPAVKKAFRILRLIAERGERLTVSEIAQALGMSKGTAYGILAALEEVGAVIKDGEKRYGLGEALGELSRGRGRNLEELVREEMRRLEEVSGETVFFGVMGEGRIVITEVQESRKELKITAPRGTRIPITAGATGKVFLASMDEGKVRRILREKGLPRYTEKSITDIERYLSELRRVREEGVAYDDEEYINGVRAVASLIDLPTPAAIWIVGFSSFMTYEKLRRLGDEIREASRRISARVRGRA